MFLKATKVLLLGLILALTASLILSGCSRVKSSWSKVSGERVAEDDDEPKVPPEAMKEEVIIDGKKYMRSKNPYYLILPGSRNTFTP